MLFVEKDLNPFYINMGKTKKYKEHLLKSLEDPHEAAAYLNACLEDEDPHVFLLALKDVADARGGMSELSRRSCLNRQSLYRTLSKKGNPKLNNVCAILSSLGLGIHITPNSQLRAR
jgi:probable addiction module antidote protein